MTIKEIVNNAIDVEKNVENRKDGELEWYDTVIEQK